MEKFIAGLVLRISKNLVVLDQMVLIIADINQGLVASLHGVHAQVTLNWTVK